MTAELTNIARAAKLDVLAYLLDMARSEAAHQAEEAARKAK
jgi:hypothetical protein